MKKKINGKKTTNRVSIVWETWGKPTCLWPSAALRTVCYMVGGAVATGYPQHWRKAHLGRGSELNAAEITRLGSRGSNSSVAAPHMEDESWGMMRKRKHKQIPFTKKFPSRRAGAAREVIYGRSQCAVPLKNREQPQPSFTANPPPICPQNSSFHRGYLCDSSVKMTT